MRAEEMLEADKLFVVLNHNGTVTLVKHQLLTVRCQYRILLFPFDVQTCMVPFGSWAYVTEQVFVEFFKSSLQDQIFEVLIAIHLFLSKQSYTTMSYSLPVLWTYPRHQMI